MVKEVKGKAFGKFLHVKDGENRELVLIQWWLSACMVEDGVLSSREEAAADLI